MLPQPEWRLTNFLPQSFSVLKIKNYPRGLSVRALLAHLAAEFKEGLMEGIWMVWNL